MEVRMDKPCRTDAPGLYDRLVCESVATAPFPALSVADQEVHSQRFCNPCPSLMPHPGRCLSRSFLFRDCRKPSMLPHDIPSKRTSCPSGYAHLGLGILHNSYSYGFHFTIAFIPLLLFWRVHRVIFADDATRIEVVGKGQDNVRELERRLQLFPLWAE